MAARNTQNNQDSFEAWRKNLGAPQIRLSRSQGLPQVGPEEQEVPKDQTQPGGLFGPTSFAGAGWAGLNQTNQSTAMANLAAGAAGLPPAQANQLDPNNAGAPGGPLKKPVFGVDKNNDGKIAGDEISEEYRLGRGGGALTGMRLGSMMAQKYTNPYAQLGAVIGATIRGLIDPEAAASTEFKEDEAEYLTKTRAQQEIELNQLRIEEGRIAIETARRGREAVAKLEATGNGNDVGGTLEQANAIIADPTMPEDVRRRAVAARSRALTGNVRAEGNATLPDNVSSIASRALNTPGLVNPGEVRSISFTASGNLRFNLTGGRTLTVDTEDFNSDKAADNSRAKLEATIRENKELMQYLDDRNIDVNFFIDNMVNEQGADPSDAMDRLTGAVSGYKGNWDKFSFRVTGRSTARDMKTVAAANTDQNNKITEATKNAVVNEDIATPDGTPNLEVRRIGEKEELPFLSIYQDDRYVNLRSNTEATRGIHEMVIAADKNNGNPPPGSNLVSAGSQTITQGNERITYRVYRYGNHTIISSYKSTNNGTATKPNWTPPLFMGAKMVVGRNDVNFQTTTENTPNRRRRN